MATDDNTYLTDDQPDDAVTSGDMNIGDLEASPNDLNGTNQDIDGDASDDESQEAMMDDDDVEESEQASNADLE